MLIDLKLRGPTPLVVHVTGYFHDKTKISWLVAYAGFWKGGEGGRNFRKFEKKDQDQQSVRFFARN